MTGDARPILFLLPADFLDPEEGPWPFVCPHCIAVEGLLAIYPLLRRELDVRYVPFKRPRTAIIDLIGEENQGVPVLVMPEGDPNSLPSAQSAGGRCFFKGEAAIADLFAQRFGTGRFH